MKVRVWRRLRGIRRRSLSDRMDHNQALSRWQGIIDPDTDTITHYEYRSDKDAALQRAQELFDTTDDLCWGIVTVRKQVVDWFYEEDRIAGWGETDEEIDIM